MPGAARKGDLCTGHGPWPSRPNTQASTTHFVEGLGVHRKTDNWAVHCFKQSCHPSHLASGSPNVFADGLQRGRIGDPVACGSRIKTGSSTVFIN